MKRKARTVGDILLDLEIILDELYVDQGLQIGDVLALVYTNSVVHYPGSIEEYEDGSNPVFYYGEDK